MTEKSTLEREWARAQVEAMADETLAGEDRERMLRASSEDPELRIAVESARQVLRRLRCLDVPQPPAGLVWRLLLPGRSTRGSKPSAIARYPGPRRDRWFVAPVGVAATALIALLFGTVLDRTASQAEQDALRDFSIAMSYLRQTAEMTSEQVGQQLGGGLVTALEMSRNSLAGDERADEQNGG